MRMDINPNLPWMKELFVQSGNKRSSKNLAYDNMKH